MELKEFIKNYLEAEKALSDLQLRINKKTEPEDDLYEFTVIESMEGYTNKKVEELQKDGWRLAGSASTYYHPNPGAFFIYIPFKRKIKTL